MTNKKPNGFQIFAQEYKKKFNLRFYNYREMLEAMAPFWNKLSDDEKELYKAKAKIHCSRLQGKRSSSSKASDVQEKKTKFSDEREERKQEVKDLVFTASDLAELDEMVFHLLSITTYFEDLNDIYPAELGLVKFSLRSGIIDTLQIKIKCGQLPSGAAFSAKEKAQNTHKYDFTREDDDDNDNYYMILRQVMDFLDPAKEVPIFYTEPGFNDKELMPVQRALVKIFENADEYQVASTLKIHSVRDLFFYLKLDADGDFNKFVSYTAINDKFTKASSLFSHLSHGCAYHERSDKVQHCALGKAVSYAFVISKYCTNPLKYPLIAGRHYPKPS